MLPKFVVEFFLEIVAASIKPWLRRYLFHSIYFLGRIVIFVVSLGRWKTEPWTSTIEEGESEIDAFYSEEAGQVYVSEGTALLTGLLVILGIVFGAVLKSL